MSHRLPFKMVSVDLAAFIVLVCDVNYLHVCL